MNLFTSTLTQRPASLAPNVLPGRLGVEVFPFPSKSREDSILRAGLTNRVNVADFSFGFMAAGFRRFAKGFGAESRNESSSEGATGQKATFSVRILEQRTGRAKDGLLAWGLRLKARNRCSLPYLLNGQSQRWTSRPWVAAMDVGRNRRLDQNASPHVASGATQRRI